MSGFKTYNYMLNVFSRFAQSQNMLLLFVLNLYSWVQVVAKNITQIALISEEATKYLAQKYLLTRDQITFGLPTADVRCKVQDILKGQFQMLDLNAFNNFKDNFQKIIYWHLIYIKSIKVFTNRNSNFSETGNFVINKLNKK